MALDPATELRELDAILASPDDPETKRQRIAMLYEEPAANDPRGLPLEATAMGGGGGMGGAPNMGGAPPGNVPDVPVEVPGAGGMGGAGGAPGAGGSGGTLGAPPPELAAQSGASGPGNVPTDVPVPAPMAASETPAPAPAPREGVTTVERPKPAAKPGAGGAPRGGIPPWLAKEMGPPETYFGRDPLARPFTQPEDAAYRALEGAQLEGTREQAEAESQAIEAGARAELAAVERGQLVDAELARREMARQNELAQMERGFAEMIAEANAEPIDSERLWNNKSTGEKILSKIALFIGTIGAGAATGNPMLIANKLDADVERDLQAQKANKAFQLNRLAAEGTLYGMARDRFASEQAVDAAMRETAWRKIGAELNAFHARAQDPQRKAAIENLMTATESRIVDAERQRRLLNETDTVARLRALAAAQQKPGAAKKAVEDPRYVPGIGYARTVKEAMAMRQGLTDYMAGKRMFHRARQLAASNSAKFGSTLLQAGTAEFHEADALSQAMANQVAKSFGGVITEGDRQAAAKEVPQLTRIWGGLDERLRAAEARFDRNYRAAVEANIIGAPTAPVPMIEGDAPSTPLPRGYGADPFADPESRPELSPATR